MSKLGVVLPFHGFAGREFIALAQGAETRGYDTAWAAEASGADALMTLALIASHTSRLRVACGVVPIQTRTPIVLAMAATTLGHVSPGRVALGVGVSSHRGRGAPGRAQPRRLRDRGVRANVRDRRAGGRPAVARA